jgi:hypothetical protein
VNSGLCLTSARLLCLRQPGPRGPRLLFAEPLGEIKLAGFRPHRNMTSSASNERSKLDNGSG